MREVSSGGTRYAWYGALPLLAVAAGACSAPAYEENEAASMSEPLWLSGTKWSNGIVPVCWDSASTTRSDFELRSRQVRDLANNSWPTVANVEFTGWGTCTSTAGKVRIVLDDSAGANVGGLPGFRPEGITMTLGVARSDFTFGLIPHEFGHVLGFHHEMTRPDFADDATGGCRESNVSGNGLNTPPDRQSIMASTGYCQNNPDLSPWDIVGAQTAYGPRTSVVRPLITGYHFGQSDHATVSTAAGITAVRNAGFAWAYPDGWVFNNQIPGTVPLKLYRHAGPADYFSTATTAGQNSATGAGYTFIRTEGFVFSSAQPGTVPLKLYWSASRQDNMLLTTSSAEAAALEAGYTFVRIEGHVPATTPYALAWTYWNTGRGDNLVTAQNSSLAVTADDANYEFAGFDGAFFKQQYPGTVPLKTFWSGARGDHFATGTAAGEASALEVGYTFLANEGFVYSSSTPGMSAAKSYWHAGRGDHFTTISRGSVATSSGYSLVRTEGWGIPIVN
jgi:hypothetical protein